jgi:hypothetical protein
MLSIQRWVSRSVTKRSSQEWAIRSLCSSRVLAKEWKISQLLPTLSECLGMRIALVHAEEWLWDQMRRTEIVFR